MAVSRARHLPGRIDAGELAGPIRNGRERAALQQMRVGQRRAGITVYGGGNAGLIQRGHALLTVWRSVHCSITCIIAVQFAPRAGTVLKRGSLASSACPVTSQSAAKFRGVIGAIRMSPSSVRTGP